MLLHVIPSVSFSRLAGVSWCKLWSNCRFECRDEESPSVLGCGEADTVTMLAIPEFPKVLVDISFAENIVRGG